MTGPEWKAVSKEAKDFISKCLIKEPSKRPGALDMLNHEWLKRAAVIRNSKDLDQT